MAPELVRDILDTQAIDRKGQPIGKVDGIVLELRDDAAPRVAYLEVDAIEAWCRLHPRLARWAARLAQRWRRSTQIYRVPWSRVLETGIDVRMDVDAESTPAYELERWLREKVIKRIPGSK